MSHSSDPDLNGRLTEYQDIALRTWIPQGIWDSNSPGFKAAHLLADLLNRHGDLWMNDFLKSVQPGDAPGLQALSEAITSNKRGFHRGALREAERAAKFFAGRNAPGELRARFELAYANQRLLKQKPCMEQAQGLEWVLRGTSYRWLQIQMEMEQAACLKFQGRFHEADERLQMARLQAESAGYPLLGLRVLAFRSGLIVTTNTSSSGQNSPDSQEAPGWQEAIEGMEQYWKAPNAPDRFYEFLSMMKGCLQNKKLWYAARAFQEQMIRVLEQETDPADRNPSLEVLAHYTLSSILMHLEVLKGAEHEANIALNVLRMLPDEEDVVGRYQLSINIDKAELQLQQDNAREAAATLDHIRWILKDYDDDVIRLKFMRVQGDVWLREGRLEEAEASYKNGLELAEKALAGLKGENRVRWAEETSEVYRGLVAVFLEQKKDLQALQLWEWSQARELEPKNNSKPQNIEISWSDIEDDVSAVPLPAQPSGIRLVYAAIKKHLYVWTIRGTGIHAFTSTIDQKSLEEMVRQYSQKCSAPAHSDPLAFEKEGKELFAVLLQPVIGEIRKGDTVAVERDRSIGGVLLETLKSPEGWYFGQQYPVIYSPGWIEETPLRPPAQADQGIFLDAQPREIPAIQGLKNSISTLYPAIQLMDPDVESWRARLTTSEMFLFFGHGKSHGLVYADNQLLKAQDFPPESLAHLQVAALIACSTGSTGDSLFRANDLVHAFLAGGTPNIIASNWDVDSKATAELMATFFHALRNGSTAAAAMFEARKSISTRYSQPYYWAAFSVTGKAN